jgi:hypothetical protein
MKKTHLGILVVIGFSIFCLAACSQVNQAKFDQIRPGMTVAQVTAILGEPTESSSVDIAGTSGTASTWKKGNATLTVQFVNGKVVAKQLSKVQR